jgi:RNA polymerase sigma factor (TIGR02999 family)
LRYHLNASMPDVTQILSAIDSGDAKAAAELLPLVYEELRKMAAHRMSAESPDHTLQPTALVHEAYLRLVGKTDPSWQNRGHFFAAAAEAMRRILVDNARRKKSVRHGGDVVQLPLDAADLASLPLQEHLIPLDNALVRLEAHDPLAAKLVQLRYYAGLGMAETATLLNLPIRTAERTWTYARTWLRRELSKNTDM